MLDQAVHVNSQVASVMFVLVLASLNLTFASPVCTECGNSTSDSASKTVVEYNVQIKESGEQYNETIEVDIEKQTVLFKVPAHGNVEHRNILHDFKKNMSLLLLPEKKICYLLPLDKELPAPRKLLSELEKGEKSYKKISDTSVIEHKWTVDTEVNDRSVLSDEMANFCAKYPIYNVKKKESLKAPRIKRGVLSVTRRKLLLQQMWNRATYDVYSLKVVQTPMYLKSSEYSALQSVENILPFCVFEAFDLK